MSVAAYQSRRAGGAVAILATALLLGGCGRPIEGSTIDGWAIGPVQTCPVPNVPRDAPWPEHWDCELAVSQWVAAAVQGFNERDAGHVPILEATLHDEGVLAVPVVRSIVVQVAVFELADGSVHAIGVGHPGVDTEHLMTFDYGP